MFQRIGAAAYKNDLTNTIDLCEGLGNPQQKFKTIHIAGTNGKGSTSHALAAVFQEHGFKTGLYTSPHLVDFRERIRINGKCIPKQVVIDFVEKHQKLVESINLSFFEATVGMAFDYFANEQVDIAIIETGLGGRLDSTNIITPILSIITNISFDHMDMLGDTLVKIASEKAGIIKSKIPVVIGETQSEVEDVFLKKAEQTESEIIFADNNPNYFNTKIQSDLKGEFQQKNLRTVLQAIEILNQIGYKFSNFKIAQSLMNVKKNTGLKGRWEVISDKPFIVADTGHNEAGLRLSINELSEINYKKLYMVFGVVREKVTENLWSFLPKDAFYLFCKPSIPRGRDVESLYEEAILNGFQGNTSESVELAFKQALSLANNEDAIFIGGSTFIVADYFNFIESQNE